MLSQTLDFFKKIIPKKVFTFFQPAYHYTLSLIGAIIYVFPSRRLVVIGVTGTKGKSSTVEIVNAILQATGKRTAVLGTIRFKIDQKSTRNLYKMTTPGRFFVQRFLRQAVDAGCTYAILEISSEAAKQYRHKFLNLNALIFLNISPEHIESHGGYEKYLDAKLSIARELAHSSKKRTRLVVNAEDKESQKFLMEKADEKIGFSIEDAKPYSVDENGAIKMTYKNQKIEPHLRGLFNIYNILAAATCASALGIDTDTIKKGVESINTIPGRVESIEAGQDFEVIVDYAHTADSLEKLYQTFGSKRKICVLGNTGGGRDKWKRPEMAKVADKYCNEIILTNEDPYDEDPRRIVEDMLLGIQNNPCIIEMDRRTAIAKAIGKAKTGDAVLITGKGTDPYIMGAYNKKTPWSDAEVAKEELEKIIRK